MYSSSGPGGRSHGRSDQGDGHRASTFNYPYNKPGFQTQIRSLPHASKVASNERGTPRLVPHISVQEDITVDTVELGNMRFATHQQRDHFDAESVSEKGLLR